MCMHTFPQAYIYVCVYLYIHIFVCMHVKPLRVILEMMMPVNVKGVRSFLGHVITGVLEMIFLYILDLVVLE